jgi:hypothetical protein
LGSGSDAYDAERYLPLVRETTGRDTVLDECWYWDGDEWIDRTNDIADHPNCGWTEVDEHGNPTPHVFVTEQTAGTEKTYVEWELTDFNGDGYPDFVFDASPVYHEASGEGGPDGPYPTSFEAPSGGQSNYRHPTHRSFRRPANGESGMFVAYNAVGVPGEGAD